MSAERDVVYRLNGVQQRYGERLVLDLEQLDLRRGETLAVIGPSGAGKSTLMRLLLFLEKPSAGRISFQGLELTTSLPIELRRSLAAAFQRPILLDLNVQENVAYGLRVRGVRDRIRRVQPLLDRLALSPLAKERARSLSGGEAQRVALARALALEPEVLLLDEPTANLDPYNVSLIEEIIKEQRARGVTIFLVTHQVFQAQRLADRAALLIGGELVETGAAESFFSRPQDPRTGAFLSGQMVY